MDHALDLMIGLSAKGATGAAPRWRVLALALRLLELADDIRSARLDFGTITHARLLLAVTSASSW